MLDCHEADRREAERMRRLVLPERNAANFCARALAKRPARICVVGGRSGLMKYPFCLDVVTNEGSTARRGCCLRDLDLSRDSLGMEDPQCDISRHQGDPQESVRVLETALSMQQRDSFQGCSCREVGEYRWRIVSRRLVTA